MGVVWTRHAREKLGLLRVRGWIFSREIVEKAIVKPRWLGRTKLGELAAMVPAGKGHVLRVIFNRSGDTIKIITVHPARKGRYEAKIQ